MRKPVLPRVLAASLLLAAAVLPNQASSDSQARHQAPTSNWADPSTWMAAGAARPGASLAFNPAHPAGWAVFIDPRTHPYAHMAFLNPATYMGWMNPAAYAVPMGAGPANPYLNWFDPNAAMQQGQGGQAFFNPFDPAIWFPQAPGLGQSVQSQ